MADMFDSGKYTFESWARGTTTPYQSKVLGPFNPDMSAKEANKLLDHEGKITTHGQELWIRGWEAAQIEYKKQHHEISDKVMDICKLYEKECFPSHVPNKDCPMASLCKKQPEAVESNQHSKWTEDCNKYAEAITKLLYPPTVGDGEGGRKPYDLYDYHIKHNKVGDEIKTDAAAPGIGYWIHKITRMDETGIYGILIQNTVRDLEPWEVE